MNLNKITFNEELSLQAQTEQPIRAFASQANTIEVLAPVSEYNTAYIVLQGLKDEVVNPKLRATQRLYMSRLSDSGEYRRWNLVIPGAILNDMSLMNSTGVRVRVEFWYIEGDHLGVEKYNTTDTATIISNLTADYPSAVSGEFVRVIDTNTDWVYNGTTWEDYGTQKLVGISTQPTESVDFALEKGIYTDEPTHAPTNTELILQELAATLKKSGGVMLGDIDMDSNVLLNVGEIVLFSATGTAVLKYDGTDLILNRNAVDESVLTELTTLDELYNVIETNIATDDILIRSGANYVNVSKASFLSECVKLSENNTFTGLNEFTQPLKVPNGVESGDAVNKGQLDGKADLVGGTVPSSQLPSFVDDVLEFATYANLPATGESGKLYVVINDETQTGNDQSIYRWSGSQYVLIHDVLSTEEIGLLIENTHYTQTEIDNLLAQLKAIYGWEDTAIGDFINTDTLAYSTIEDYDFILATWHDTNVTPEEVFTVYFKPEHLALGRVVETQIQNTPYRTGAISHATQGTLSFLILDANNNTVTGNGFHIHVTGVKMEQQLAENIAYDTTNVKAELDANRVNDNQVKEKVAEQEKEINDLKSQLAIANANNEPLVTQSVIGSVDHLPVNAAPLPLKVNGYGLSLENIVDGENVVDSGSVSFDSVSGVTYYDSLNQVLITGDGTTKTITNNTGATVDIMVIPNRIGYTASQFTALALTYFSGRKDIVNPTVESVGKNLFDKTKYTTVDYAYKIEVEPSNTYIWSESIAYKTYDKDLNEVASGTATTLTMGADTYYIAFANTIADKDAFQLEQGLIATTYEAYAKQSKTYVGTFRSLPNGVQDEFNDEGVKVKKIQELLDFSSIIEGNYSTGETINYWAGFTNEINDFDVVSFLLSNYNAGLLVYGDVNTEFRNYDGLALASSAKRIYFKIPKSEVASNTVSEYQTWFTNLASKLYYKLVTPTEEPILTLGDMLQGSSKAQIINSSTIADLTLYDTNAEILLTDSPITTLDYLGVMDFDTGVITDLDHTTATVAGDGLSFTHASLSSGDIVVFRYTSTRINGQLDVTYVNNNAIIEDTANGNFYHITFSVTNGTPTLVATEVG